MPHSHYRKTEQSWKKHKPKKYPIRHSGAKKNSIFKIISVLIKKPFKGIKKLGFKGFLKKFIIFSVVAGLFGSLFLVAIFGYYSRQLPDINTILNRFVAQSTKIYDRSGEVLLFEVFGGEKRTIVELDQVSDYIVNALISAEDKNFYKHKGVSFTGILRAAIKNILTGSSQGGSTLTQQMIKNTILTREKTYSRKIKELILAQKAEKTFTKDEILKIYLNTINYGGVNYGVESASQAFFGKHAKDVTLAEAAILAALPQAPTRLSPYGNNVDQLMARKNWVLDRMAEEGYITKEQAENAKQEKINFQELKISNIKAPHFVFYVQELLAEQFGEDVVNAGGLKVITTLDWNKQEIAENVVNEANEFNLSKGATDASLVSLDAKTGEILAMVGSQDYFNDEIDGQVNVAIEPRQPGSSIKPIVYASALEKGFTSETVVYDVKTNFAVSGKPYEPNNYDLQERGPVTFRTALQGSLNIPAVKALYLAGVDKVMKKMEEELNYSTITKDLDCGLSLVLGGCEVTLLDHTAAYTSFARDGQLAKPAAILEVYDNKGKKIFEFKPQTKKVWDKEIARSMNNILSDNEARTPFFGANSYLQLGDRPVAAKTGTTNDYNDAWTIGYTPSFVTGVWVGNADGTDMQRGAGGSAVAAPIWNAYMKKILENTPIETFKKPKPLAETLPPVLRGDISGTIEVEVDKFSGKLATEFTPESAREKRTYVQHHSILHYLDKDNPLKIQPEDWQPTDPAYETWEQAVQDWVIRDFEKRKKEAEEKGEEFSQDIFSGQPPTEYDDVHLPQFKPSISITNLQNAQEITSPSLEINVSVQAPRGVNRVEYYLDDQILGASHQPPFNIKVYLNNTPNGFATLKAIAYDDVDNSAQTTIDLNIKLNLKPITVNWQSPQNGSTYSLSEFPLPLNFSISSTNNLKEINVYAFSNGQRQLVQNLRNLTINDFSILWTEKPSPGVYQIYLEFIRLDGSIATSKTLQLTLK